MSTLEPVRPTAPLTVATTRGLIYGVVTALIAAVVALTPADIATLGPIAPFLAIAARMAEAAILDRRQPPQLGRLGGKGPA